MSKSMAIDSIMKIFLMIAVIIVGVSFLMKAFGIDIFAWLKNKFGGIDVPSEGKALYIRMKAGADEGDVHAFTLIDETDVGKYKTDENEETIGLVSYYSLSFQISKANNPYYDNNCMIWTLEERTKEDRAFIYYVKPGTVIQGQIDSLSQYLAPYIGCKQCDSRWVIQKQSDLCESGQAQCDWATGNPPSGPTTCPAPFGIVNCAHQGLTGLFHTIFTHFPVCDTDELVLNKFAFSTLTKLNDGCVKNGLCDLLDYREVKKEAFYGSNVKYGLVCADDHQWHTCTKADATEKVGGATATCAFNVNIGTWKFLNGDPTIDTTTTTCSSVPSPPLLCQGDPKFTIVPNKISMGQDVTFSVSGMSQCGDAKVYFFKTSGGIREDVVGVCTPTGSGCSVPFKPSEKGLQFYEAIIDRDGDGKINSGTWARDSSLAVLTVE